MFRLDKDAFPRTINADGREYRVNPDFRTVLGILHSDNISLAILRDFFIDECPVDYGGAFSEFINPPDDCEDDYDDEPEEKRFDYIFDAEEIYSSFMRDYGIDLADIEYLHWRSFQILLNGLSETSPLREKISLRFMDTNEYTGEKRVKVEKAKARVQLPEIMTEDEILREEAFRRKWEI